ncbi:hypothetical protein FRAHR75_760007 [Frankia sp. Hr75.2]|nr:hypothetical protein FRAHR75_760007 [Frankia sp. Hr75.2]
MVVHVGSRSSPVRPPRAGTPGAEPGWAELSVFRPRVSEVRIFPTEEPPMSVMAGRPRGCPAGRCSGWSARGPRRAGS